MLLTLFVGKIARFCTNMFSYSPSTSVDLRKSLIKSQIFEKLIAPVLSADPTVCFIDALKVASLALYRVNPEAPFFKTARALVDAQKVVDASAEVGPAAAMYAFAFLSVADLCPSLEASDASGLSVKELKRELAILEVGIEGMAEKGELVKALEKARAARSAGGGSGARQVDFSRAKQSLGERVKKIVERLDADPALLIARDTSTFRVIMQHLQSSASATTTPNTSVSISSSSPSAPSPKSRSSAAASAGKSETSALPPPPQEIICALTGSIMTAPVRTPQGILCDRAAMLEALSLNGGKCPKTGASLTPADLKPAKDIEKMIIEYQIKCSSAYDLYEF